MLIDVIYLARGKDWGLEAANKFFASYKKYQAGAEHKVIIAAKAWDEKPDGYKKLCEKAHELGATVIDLPDDGYDLGAYYRIAKHSKADYIFCLVSTSEICAENWLLKFVKAFEADPTLKYAGTTASYGPTPLPLTFASTISKLKWSKRSIKHKFLKFFMAIDNIRRNAMAKFCPHYRCPNPQIRTNAFMIARLLYISAIDIYGFPKNKKDTFHFESGRSSLTRFIKNKHFNYAIIGREGQIYKEKDWPISRTFFDFDTSNVLIKDRANDLFRDEPKRYIKNFGKFCAWGITHKEEYSTPLLFSVLLPTKNRLDLLKHAVASVQNQTYPHWELIISDNFSEEGVEEYATHLNDKRIIYMRTNKPISLTENWNTAQDMAHGDYTIMLGDDDALLPDFFEKCVKYMEQYQYPDLLNFGACLYLQANVSPQYPNGFCIPTSKFSYPYMKDCNEPYLLDLETRKNMIQANFRFDYQYNFTMQSFVYSKNVVFELLRSGQVFEAPYPNYFAVNAMMLVAKRVLVIPEDLLIIGIMSKSYTAYSLNKKEKEGMFFLHQAEYRDYALDTVINELCNIADLETAAFATFAHIPPRLAGSLTSFSYIPPHVANYPLKLNFASYYKAVIRRIVRDYDKKEAWEILRKEFFTKVSILKYYMYYQYIREEMKHKAHTYINEQEQNTIKSPENISLLIEDIMSGNLNCQANVELEKSYRSWRYAC